MKKLNITITKWQSIRRVNEIVDDIANAHVGHGLHQCVSLCWFVVESHDGFAIRSGSSFEMHRLTQGWGS